MTHSTRQFLRTLFDKAVAVADPMNCVPEHLLPRPKGRLIVVGAGKASARMAEALEEHYQGPIEGLVITRYGYQRPTKHVQIVQAAHPVPDATGVVATTEMLKLLARLTTNDLVIALISGGGSSLLCAPIDGISLADKQLLNAKLLASGAPISEMNIVRRHFSRVKGGKLAAAAAPAPVHALIISDVPGDDINIIASGPTVPLTEPTTSPFEIIKKWKLDLPQHMLDLAQTNTSTADVAKNAISNKVIAAPSQSLSAAASYAREHGYEVQILGDALEGEARELGREHARLALELAEKRKDDQKILILSGGECTVTRQGNGIGGPNAEYALSAMIALNGHPNISLLSADTDGVDGAAEVAGAYVYPNSLLRAQQIGLNPESFLDRNDAHTFFEGMGDQLVTGPTLTNVNDFRAILIGR
jgi:glycerate 2-kinase